MTEQTDAVSDRRIARIKAFAWANCNSAGTGGENGFIRIGNICRCKDKEQGADSAQTKQFLSHSTLLKMG